MEKVIIIRYGEIFLKGKNRDYFESLLIKNIKQALSGLKFDFTRSQGRYFIENFDIDDEPEFVDRLKKSSEFIRFPLRTKSKPKRTKIFAT